MIPKEDLKKMFDNISENTTWNIKGKMLWGYFFFDENPDKLKLAAKKFEDQKYIIVDIYQTDDKTSYVLHVEKEEIHTVDSLFKRNSELTKFANDNKLDCYDGMDVGPIKSNNK